MPLKVKPIPEFMGFRPPVKWEAKPLGLIADTLNEEVVDRHRSNNYTVEDYRIHVSDLIQMTTDRRFCSRQTVLSFIEARNRSYRRKISAGMRLIHKMGHAIQELVTDDFIERSPFGNRVWGNWRCLCGETTVEHSLRPIAGTCNRCGRLPHIYVEINLFDDEYRITGHPDLLILWNDTLHIYEIKTIDRASIDFDTLDAPLGDHTLQATFYYWMMRKLHSQGKLPFPPSHFLDYLYIDRSSKKVFGRRVYKEFQKRASPAERIMPMIDKARQINDSLRMKLLPERICDGPNAPRAKACHVCGSCFMRQSKKFV